MIESATENEGLRVFDLAHHFLEARDPRAMVYQMQAGEMALDAFAYEDAVQHFTHAESLIDVGNPGFDLFRLRFLQASAYQGTADVTPGLNYFEQAKELASTGLERAECLFGIGVTHMRLGDVVQARDHFGAALAEVGQPLPKKLVSQLFALASAEIRLRWPRWLRLKGKGRNPSGNVV